MNPATGKLVGLILLRAFLVVVLAPALTATQSRQAELVVQTGHASSVRTVAFSPDGKLIASLGLDSTVKLWDRASRKELRSIGGSEASASVAFSPDGKTLATVSFKTRSVMMFATATGELIRKFPPAEDVIIWELRFSPDGDTIATLGYYNRIRFYSIRQGTEIRTRYLGGRFGAFTAIAFSPDGRYLASMDERGIVVFEVFGTDGFAFPMMAEQVAVLAFSPDGKFLVSGDSNAEIHVFDLANRTRFRTVNAGRPAAIASLDFSNDGSTLASGSADGWITLWDFAGGLVPLQTAEGHTKAVYSLDFSPDGGVIASGGYDDTIRLWNSRTLTDAGTLAPIASMTFAVEFSRDGRYLAMSKENGAVMLWNAESGTEVRTLSGHAGVVWRTAFSPDGKIIASGGVDRTIRLWDVESGKLIRGPLHGHIGEVRRLAFSPDGVTLASGDSKGWIILWNMRTGERRDIEQPADSHEINALKFSPNGKILASGGWQPMKLWDTAAVWEAATSPKLLREVSIGYSMISAIAFSRDGASIAMAANKQYEKVPTGSQYVEEGQMIRVMSSDTLQERGSYSLEDETYRPEFEKQFPDGFADFNYEASSPSLIAKAVQGSRIRLSDRLDRKEIASLIATDDGRWTVVAPDGRFDTNNSLDQISGLHWIDPAEPFTPIPLEIFMRQYYEPGLFSRLARCRQANTCAKEFRTVPRITEVNRIQPRLEKLTVSQPKADGTVDVSVDVESVIRDGTTSGVFDLRLFVDRQLVASSVPRSDVERYIADTSGIPIEDTIAWRRTHDLSGRLQFREGKATHVFRNIRLPRDGRSQVEISSYAFNSDRVKSETVRTTVNIGSVPRSAGRTILVTIGVNASESPKYNLDFAANDARQMQEIIGSGVAAVGRQVIRVELISERDKSGRLTRNLATKRIIKGVFDLLSGRRDEVDADTLSALHAFGLDAIRPEDTLIIGFSGHGYTRNGVFYMLPYDIGESTGAITPGVLPQLISSDELSLWMREIVAREIIFVVDACHSAASVQGQDFKPGPMGSRGLGQLAYDKGMRVLAAAQTNNVALELKSLQHGLLSYALLQDGVVRGLADTGEPRDGVLTADEWLSYAVNGVPQLYRRVIEGKVKLAIDGQAVDVTKLNEKQKADEFCEGSNCGSRASVQQPVLFDFARQRRAEPFLKLNLAAPPPRE